MFRTARLPKNKYFSAAVTGLRAGDVLIGGLTSNNDAIVRVAFDSPAQQWVAPSLDAIDRAFAPEYRDLTLSSLRKLPRFRTFANDAAIEAALRAEAGTRKTKMFDNVFEKIPGLCLQFITLGAPVPTSKNASDEKDGLPQHFVSGRMATPEQQAALLAFDTPQNYQRVILDLAPNMATFDTDGDNKVLVTTLDQWVPIAFDLTIRGPFDGTIYSVATGAQRRVTLNDGNLDLLELRPYTDKSALMLEEVDSHQGPWPDLAVLAKIWNISAAEVLGLEPWLRDLTLGALKSLIQKLIRFRPQRVSIRDFGTVSARSCLILAALIAGTHRGTFIPDMQAFQSGAHSLAKRLLVILYEDAKPPANSTDKLRCLGLGALLAQYNSEWRPPVAVLQQWVDLAVGAYETSAYLPHPARDAFAVVEWDAGHRATANVHEFLSTLLDVMGSFEGDKQLLRQAAAQPDIAILVRDYQHPQPAVMPFLHYLDQHVDANLVYFFNGTDVARELGPAQQPGHGPYDTLFSRLFEQVTGINSRHARIEAAEFETRTLVAAHRRAASRLYDSKRHVTLSKPRDADGDDEMIDVLNGSESDDDAMDLDADERLYKHTLEDGWLAAMVGQIAVKVGAESFYVLLDTEAWDEEPQVIRCPRRKSDKNADDNTAVPMATADAARSKAYALLEAKDGYPLKGCDVPDAKFKGARIRRILDTDDGEFLNYEVRLASGEWQSWEQARELRRTLAVSGLLRQTAGRSEMDTFRSYLAAHPVDALLALHEVPTSMYRHADELVISFVRDHERREVLQRLLQWIQPRGGTIIVPTVTRDVGSAKEALSREDPAAYRLLCMLCMLYPIALAPQAHSVTRFLVKEPLVVWDLVDKLKTLFRAPPPSLTSTSIRVPSFASLNLRTHQNAAVADMERTVDGGQSGRIVWMSVGSGKTRTAAGIIVKLHERGLLPTRVLFVGPKEALPGNLVEFQALGFPTRMVMTKKEGKAKGAFAPGAIILIKSELLRDLTSELESIAPESMLILDELHMYMDPTRKRTQAGTMLAMLSRFFIGMTGTLVTNNNPMTFGRWIGYTTVFPVTPSNVWVAAMAISHYEIAPPARANFREELFDEARLPADYWTTLPEKFGGRGKRIGREVIQTLWEQCYQQSYQRMIELAVTLLQRPATEHTPADRDAAWGGKAHALVFVVRREADVASVRQRLLEATAGVLRPAQVGVLGENGLHHVTDKGAATDEVVKQMRVVFITAHMDKGFELSRCDVMLMSVYFSSLAKRRQREGRINRLGQTAKDVFYITVHGGFLTRTLQYYNEASSIERVMVLMALQ